MYHYRSLINNISVSKDLPLYKLPLILYKCRPLMPATPLIRVKVIASYLLTYIQSQFAEFTLPISGEIVLRLGKTIIK